MKCFNLLFGEDTFPQAALFASTWLSDSLISQSNVWHLQRLYHSGMSIPACEYKNANRNIWCKSSVNVLLLSMWVLVAVVEDIESISMLLLCWIRVKMTVLVQNDSYLNTFFDFNGLQFQFYTINSLKVCGIDHKVMSPPLRLASWLWGQHKSNTNQEMKM